MNQLYLKPIIFLWHILSAGIFLSACTRDVDPDDFPQTQPRLVISCYLSPQDTLITLSLTESNPAALKKVEGEFISITDASVTLTSEGNSVKLKYNPEMKMYTADPHLFRIEGGKSYHLSVNTPSGKSATANCNIPDVIVPVPIVEIDSTTNTSSYYWTIQVSWTDTPGMRNDYKLYGNFLWKDRYADTNSYITDKQIYFDVTDQIVSDTLKDGSFLGPYEATEYSAPNPKYILDVWLVNGDEHYLKYFNTKNEVEAAQYNPFAEPINYYSNIEGGLGLFAGVQMSHVQIKNFNGTIKRKPFPQ